MIKLRGSMEYGDVPKWLKGPDSKSCGAFGFPSSEILDIWCFLDYAVSSRLDSIYAFSTLCAE